MAGSVLRVVHVYKDGYPPVFGGIERHIHTLQKTLPSVTSDILVCARGPRSSSRQGRYGLETRVAEFGRVMSAPLAPTFPRWLARQRADVVHLHMPNPTGELSALALRLNTPLLVSYHADVVRQARLLPLYRPLLSRCLRRAERIVVPGHGLAAGSDAVVPWRDKLTVIPFGVDTAMFDPHAVPDARKRAIRDRLGIPLIVFLGRLVHYKGIDVLIDAARELNASVAVIGAGPLESALRRHAAGNPRVRMLGAMADDDMIAHLAAADCFVLPSVNRAESFGIATLEAQSMGLPAVVSAVGTSTTEAIDPGVTGLVVPPQDARALAGAVRELLRDGSRRTAMGRAARARVLVRHDAALLAARWIELYEQVAATRPGPW